LRKLIVFVLLLSVLFCVLPFPALADNVIPPVSASQLSAKLQSVGDEAYGMASPLVDMVAKLMLALAGIMLLLMLVFGPGIMRRVFGICFSVACGLLLFYCAPYIVVWIKAIGAYLGT
jgi:hypothetical protein